MKIGILTLPLHTNYGGILQAYALQTVLKRMGHDAWIIKREYSESSFFKFYYIVAKELINKYIFKKPLFVVSSKKEKRRIYSTNMQLVQGFLDQHLQPRTETYHSSSKLKANMVKYQFDAYIVGSDQVWRRWYAKDILSDFFLGFVGKNESARRISYAASFGVDHWEYTEQQTEMCARLIRQFDAVSVRETAGIQLCKNYFGVEAQQVLDPTLLLGKSDYEYLIENQPKEERQLLCYILDNTEDKKNVVDRLTSYYNYMVFSVNNPKEHDGTAALEERKAYPVELWLGGFRDAKFVVTDSFHACIFSILFKKPFFVYANPMRGLTRFKSLLTLLGLEDRIIFSSNDITDEKLSNEINWNEVYDRLEKEKAKSFSFLQQALME